MILDPFDQFKKWYDEAAESGIREPNAMTLATAKSTGEPSARMVLLKGMSEAGFVFFTNYDSQKGTELIENPHAALLFYWPSLERQVRITGSVEKIPAEESDSYFASRPRGAQLGAHVSRQSSVISDRDELVKRFSEVEGSYGDRTVDRPEYWGGFRVTPSGYEFWQGRENRLHDRVRYRQQEGAWIIERLSP